MAILDSSDSSTPCSWDRNVQSRPYFLYSKKSTWALCESGKCKVLCFWFYLLNIHNLYIDLFVVRNAILSEILSFLQQVARGIMLSFRQLKQRPSLSRVKTSSHNTYTEKWEGHWVFKKSININIVRQINSRRYMSKILTIRRKHQSQINQMSHDRLHISTIRLENGHEGCSRTIPLSGLWRVRPMVRNIHRQRIRHQRPHHCCWYQDV